ncbi:MAG: RecX family transcriptional regulator [Chloroflexi bacterium]|nr:RecX family transcriptional regulator [Chloroflexota bacterium]
MITALRVKGGKKQVSVFIDGSFSFAIGEEVAATAGLKVGQHLSAEQIEELKEADLSHNCFGAALHYLDYRPRSEAEVRKRLRRRGFDGEVVDEVISGLKERRLIDDVAFAHYWRENRLSFRPRSRRLIKLELRQKGVAAEIANEEVADLDDETAAYEAGLKKTRVLSGLEYREFRRYLSDHLRRRGFDYGTIDSAVARLWQERQPDSA